MDGANELSARGAGTRSIQRRQFSQREWHRMDRFASLIILLVVTKSHSVIIVLAELDMIRVCTINTKRLSSGAFVTLRLRHHWSPSST
jgi:hypothetical protein